MWRVRQAFDPGKRFCARHRGLSFIIGPYNYQTIILILYSHVYDTHQAGISEVIYHEGKVHQPSRRQSRAASHSGGDDSGALPSEPSPAPQGSCAEHHHHHHHDHHAMGIGCLNTRGPAPVPSLAARGPPSSGATNLESPAALGEPPLGTASTAHTALPLLHDDGPMLSLSGFPLPRPSLSGAEVVDPTYLASMKLFQLAGVKLRQHRLMGSVTIVPS